MITQGLLNFNRMIALSKYEQLEMAIPKTAKLQL